MKKFHKLAISSLFPKHCAYCDRLIPGDKTTCSKCLKTLPRIEGKICPKCGIEKSRCNCKGRENYYETIAAQFYYEGNVRRGIHIYKFRHSVQNAEAFSAEMANTIKDKYSNIKIDYITAVPSTKHSLKKRGYDQVDILADKTAALAGLEYKPQVLSKIYETDIQHGLSAIMRRGNLAGVFDVNNPADVEGKTILLCDDISTSGETLNECAKMLWLYGADKIYCIALAITAPKKPER